MEFRLLFFETTYSMRLLVERFPDCREMDIFLLLLYVYFDYSNL